MRSEDIAKIVGVSRSTVSRVINNYPDIPPATREKVLKAIEEYNYVPNASARKLAGAKNNLIAIFVLDINIQAPANQKDQEDEPLLHNNPFFSPIINSVCEQANRQDYNVLVSIISSKQDIKKIETIFSQKMIDGAIFVGMQESDSDLIANLINQKHIIAIIDTKEFAHTNQKAILINGNNYDGSCLAVQHLLELGHVQIGIITGNLNKLSAKERLKGYQDTLLRNNIPINEEFIYHGDFIEQSGYEGTKYLLSHSNPPTAIFVSNDTMVTGAYQAIKEHGLSIPDDISIIGFDNAIYAQYLSPPLTTVDMPFSMIAHRATTLLIEAIQQNEQKDIIEEINTKLIKRQSCKPLFSR